MSSVGIYCCIHQLTHKDISLFIRFSAPDHIEKSIGITGNHSIMDEKLITQVVALVDVALFVPAVATVERDWLAPTGSLSLILLFAIVAAAFVAVDRLSGMI
jgi:hypothetical protein